ncbi:MAG TPA: TRAP transporter substrate-binding protein DctP [Candidatus Aminicenantes bacterium]|nr:TRAP transporter substrate-binding protein DctP [Candidatus Aminicenantes bacterium]
MTKRAAAALSITLALGALPAASAAPGPAAAPAVVLKIASIAPERSPWGKALEKVAAEWERLSNGAVRVRIFPGAIAGNEQDMIRKMRLGVLQGGVFSSMGLAKVDPSLTVLSIPFLFRSREEFNSVFERVTPTLEKTIEGKGFHVVLWTLAGWVNFFTKGPVVDPDDLKKFKMSVTADFPDIEQVWKRMGFEVVTGEEKTLLIQLQSGAASGAYLPPLLAASGQYFPLVPHMFGPSLAPLVGGLLLSGRAWASLPAELHQPFLEAVVSAARGLYDETMALEADAVKMMKENGLVVHDAPPDMLAKWYETADRAVDKLIGPVFSKELYDRVVGYVQEYRKDRGR